MKIKSVDDLNKLYEDADTTDREIFAEFRSNVLLIAGDHYSKRSNYFSSLRDNREKSNEQKLRLTKNHIYKVVKSYVTNILSYAPGTTVVPQRESEIQDQKAAELNNSVWSYLKDDYRINEIKREACFDYCGIGEVCYKIFFDPSKGKLKGYAQMLDESGMPVVDPMTGEPVADEESPQFEGRFVFERVFGFNLFRDPRAQSMKESPWLGIRKMVDIDTLKDKYKGDPDKLKSLEESKGEEFIVFDSVRNSYTKTKDQTLVKEIYIRPSPEYPEGYFYIWTYQGILEEGTLPLGIFPIVWQGFDEYPTVPRGRSIIKVARPWQGEINRAASAQAMHQITIGDDKIVYQSGTKLQQGALLPGIRGITYQGAAPTILAGRDGAQYENYVQSQEQGLYRAVSLEELAEEKNQDKDPLALLFASVAQKKKFSVYIEKFEQFLKDFTTLTLELARYYLPDDCVIPAIGKAEFVNISEFRSSGPLNYLIKVEPREETMETQLGKQIMIQHLIQYAGTNLEREDIGKLIRCVPYANFEEMFDDFTINYDNVKNDILALERGELPEVGQYDENEYYVQRLSHRIKQKDFQFLDPQIQQNFYTFMQGHEQAIAQKQQALIDAKNEYIPTGGAMVAADIYIPDEADPTKAPKRARVPYQALEWLIEKLQAQGTGLEKLEVMNQGNLEEISKMLLQNQAGNALPQGGSLDQMQGGLMPDQAEGMFQ